ncbi:hypothetical protein CLV59_11266 [Chitinophaga dinghuensis]|uniref:Uncharacterized protein n=1 Tax=Chitinophaga dinghuensis TaxID=1539050 RepID=A0A327VKJ8_9BACT|nr:hypothetical protein [Chitinophaga dinghuensis]RAJ73725.1 hypothetical protein CLV59_11266 [Chitinophaga dinghuensis]
MKIEMQAAIIGGLVGGLMGLLGTLLANLLTNYKNRKEEKKEVRFLIDYISESYVIEGVLNGKDKVEEIHVKAVVQNLSSVQQVIFSVRILFNRHFKEYNLTAHRNHRSFDKSNDEPLSPISVPAKGAEIIECYFPVPEELRLSTDDLQGEFAIGFKTANGYSFQNFKGYNNYVINSTNPNF